MSSPSPPSQTAIPSESSGERLDRWRWWILALFCVVGLGVRVARFGQLSIEHFDEGVYASNVYAEQLAPIMGTDVYPSRHLYAPPLFPWLCELAIRLGGTPDAAIWVNLLFGTAMIPLIWFVARDQLGPTAAIVAAGLCATSDYHIFFSRSALTDVSLGFWLLLSVWLSARGIQSGRKRELIGAGVAAALAWWTKYNGWLAVLIPLGGAGLSWGLDRLTRAKVGEPEANPLLKNVAWASRPCTNPQESRAGRPCYDGFPQAAHFLPLTRVIVRWLIVAVVAALLWIPVLYDLQSVGGYASVAANHKTYLVGIAGWWNGLRMHMGFLGLLTSVIGVCGVLLIAACLVRIHGDKAAIAASLMAGAFFVLPLTGAGMTWGCFAALAILLIVGGGNQSRLFWAMLVVWWLGLSLTTPLYRPYARLSLPWLVASWLLAGFACERIGRTQSVNRLLYVVIFSFPLMIWSFSQILGPPETLNGSHAVTELPMPVHRTGMRTVVGQITHEIDMAREGMKPSAAPGFDAAVYVVGEPALYCHLSHATQDRFVIVPGPNMSVAAPMGGTYLPKFIVTGAHVPEAEIEAALGTGQIQPVWEQNILVSDMVAIDSAGLDEVTYHGPRKGRGLRHNTMKIRVFRIRD